MNWALVIGCDAYWRAEACLSGAVRDALAMRTWLLAPDGGCVPPENLELLLSPHGQGEQPPSGLPFESATNEAIQKAHHRLVERSGGQGHRLFVHFSGHGLTGRVNHFDEPAIAPTDFDFDLTDRALTIRSVAEYFATTGFAEQFLFFDACRDMPLEEEFEVGRIARPRKADYSVESPQQYICFATAPGLAAIESSEPAGERGVFTATLLKGLRGDGRAKRWDREERRYRVSWNELFKYVETAVVTQRLDAGEAGARIQRPRMAGEHGSANPELASFSADAFVNEPLTLSIDPAAAAPKACVSVLRDEDDDWVTGPPATLPADVHLPPRSYTVRAQADGYRPRRRSWYVELYQPSDLRLEFDAGDGEGDTGLEALPVTRGAMPAAGTAQLGVRTEDPVAIVDIHDEAGRLVASGAGFAQVQGSGWFRARAIAAGGGSAEARVELQPGEQGRLTLQPGPAASELAVSLAERAGLQTPAVAAPAAGTVLTLAAACRMSGSFWTEALHEFGAEVLGALKPDAPVHVIVADERAGGDLPAADLRGVRGRSSCELGSRVAGVAAMSMWADTGSHLLTVHAGAAVQLSMPVHVIDGRPTLVVIEIGRTGQPLVLQQNPSPERVEQGPGGIELRRFDAAQRFAAAREPQRAWELMVRARPGSDPLADCFADYLRLRLGLAPAGRTGLATDEPGDQLPDRRLLSLLQRGGGGGEHAWGAATGGLPVFDQGLLALADLTGDPALHSLTAQRVGGQTITTLAGQTTAAATTGLGVPAEV